MISSMTGNACIAAMVCSMMGLPAILMSCLGMFSPTRVPVPPARTTATLRKVPTGPTIPGSAADSRVEAPSSAPHEDDDPLGRVPVVVRREPLAEHAVRVGIPPPEVVDVSEMVDHLVRRVTQ